MSVKVTIDSSQKNSGEAFNMCAGCPGYCCQLSVDLTSYDIVRINAVEERIADEFAVLVEASDTDAYGIRLDGAVKKIILKHEGTHCVFFDKKAKLGCTIEGSKPSICLYYPFYIQKGRPVIQEKALCPPKNRYMIDNAKMSQDVLDACYWEMERYEEFVTDWNALTDGKRSIEEFLKFARSEMGHEMNPVGSLYRKLKRKAIRLIARKR